jgi:protein SCO1/2
MHRRIASTVSLCLSALVVSPALFAQMPASHQHHMGAAGEGTVTNVSGLSIPDIVLVNQRGEKVHFYSDLIRNRVVAINTIFTTCTTICPVMGAGFASLRKTLQAKGPANASLISISIDPLADTPERLAEWSRGFGETGPGWTLLTGPKADVDRLLKALGLFTADKNDHAPVTLIGGDDGAGWSRAPGLYSSSRLAELIRARTAVAQR